jgi:dTDP-4-amino-4,6-dideoxygalactose transaminase
MERIAAICKKHGLLLIEDASHSFGATLRGKQMGTFGKAAIFSFSSLKSISTGYGGMVISDDTALIASIQQTLNSLRPCTVMDMQGILRKNIVIGLATQRLLFGYAAFPAIRFLNRLDPKIVSRLQTDNPVQKLLHEVPREWLWQFSPLQADLALRCLKRLDAENATRQKHARIVLDVLGPHAPDRLPALLAGAENVFWRFPFKVPEGHEFAKFMNRYGIDVTTTLLPCCSQMEIFGPYAAATPHASAAVRETYFLPIEHSLTEQQVSTLAQAAVEFVRAGA